MSHKWRERIGFCVMLIVESLPWLFLLSVVSLGVSALADLGRPR